MVLPLTIGWRPLVALLLALSASGGVGVALDGLRGPVHRCRCHHGPDEDCGCSMCHRALRAAAEDARLPPCHRAAAKARLARAAKQPGRTCMKGSCGGEDENSPRAPRQEPVVLARLPTVPRVLRSEPIAGTAWSGDRAAERPATPPPRAS